MTTATSAPFASWLPRWRALPDGTARTAPAGAGRRWHWPARRRAGAAVAPAAPAMPVSPAPGPVARPALAAPWAAEPLPALRRPLQADEADLPPGAVALADAIAQRLELVCALWLGGASATARTLLGEARSLLARMPAIPPDRTRWLLQLRQDIDAGARLLREPSPARPPQPMPQPGEWPLAARR